MVFKKCTKCGIEQPATIEYFYERKNSYDGLRSECKTCNAQYYKETAEKRKEEYKENAEKIKKSRVQYRKENAEKIKEYKARYRKNNSEKIKKYNAQYRKDNLDKIKENDKQYYKDNFKKIKKYKEQHYQKNLIKIKKYQIQWRKENAEEIKKYKAQYRKDNLEKIKEYYKNNAEKIKKYKAQWRKENPKYGAQWCKDNPEKRRATQHKRIAREKELPATLTLAQWDICKEYFNNKCAYCGKDRKLQQEHFVALSKGGEYTINNIIPACGYCNNSKHNKDFFGWYPKYEFYSKTREKKILKYLQFYEGAQQLKLN